LLGKEVGFLLLLAMFHVEHSRHRLLGEKIQGEFSGEMRDDVPRGTLLKYISPHKRFPHRPHAIPAVAATI
jgi:hypothetical protein